MASQMSGSMTAPFFLRCASTLSEPEPEPDPHPALQYGIWPHDLVVLRERILSQVCAHAQAAVSSKWTPLDVSCLDKLWQRPAEQRLGVFFRVLSLSLGCRG